MLDIQMFMQRYTTFKINIATKIGFLSFLLVLISSLVIGAIYYKFTADFLVQKSFKELDENISVQSVRIETQIEKFKEDIRFLSNLPPISGLARTGLSGGVDPLDGSTKSEWQSRLAIIFEEYLKSKPYYYEARLISIENNGEEIVRVEKLDGLVVRAKRGLQQEGETEYYKETIKLQREQVYLSKINLRKEYGVITLPETPVMRVSTAVFNEKGEVFGVLALNLDFGYVLSHSIQNKHYRRIIYVVNEEGDYLLHPEKRKAFGFEHGVVSNVYKDFPGLRQSKNLKNDIQSTERIIRVDKNELMFKTHSIQYDELRPNKLISFIHAIPLQQVLKNVSDTRDYSFFATLIMVAIASVLALIFSLILTMPLKQIMHATRKVAEGSSDYTLPVGRSDEIGQLADSVEKMASDLKKQKQSLLEKNQSIKNILGSITSAFIVLDYNWHFIYVNSNAEKMFDDNADLIGEVFWDKLPKSIDSTFSMLKDIMQTTESSDHEIYFSPHKKWYHMHVYPSLNGVTLYLTDINEMKVLEDKLFREKIEQKELLNKLEVEHELREAILGSLSAHIAVLDYSGSIMHVNKAWTTFGEENQGYWGNVSGGINYLEVCENAMQNDCDGALMVKEGIEKVIEGELDKFEYEYPCHSATTQRWFLLNVTPLEGEERGAVISHVNITTRKLAEEGLRKEKTEVESLLSKVERMQSQLVQTEKMASIGQLAAGVAHEINNPVGYVSSNISSLKKYIGDLFEVISVYESAEAQLHNSKVLEKIKQIKADLDLTFLKEDIYDLLKESEEGVFRVKKIVEDLKDFSHVDESDWQLVDIHAGLNSTLNIVNNEIKYKAEVSKDYGEMPKIECMPSRLNQVFMNLLVNAAHAIDQKGKISLRTGVSDDQWVWVEISDTGKGISRENVSRIFDPFFTTKPIGKGTGLGLSLSYGIIEKHGGKIEVSSELGIGTVFKIILPIRQEKIKGGAHKPALVNSPNKSVVTPL